MKAKLIPREYQVYLESYCKYRTPKRVIGILLSICLSLIATITCSPDIARAIDAGVCIHNPLNELTCNVLKVSNDNVNFGYPGTYGFSHNGTIEENFCIEAGAKAEDTGASYFEGETALTDPSRNTGWSRIGIQEKGFGNEEQNARYIVSWVISKYFSGEFDALGQQPQYAGMTIYKNISGVSYGHIVAAAAISILVHAWFDRLSHQAFLTDFFATIPPSLYNFANIVVGLVPNVNPGYSDPHIVLDSSGTGNQSYLMIKLDAGTYLQGKTLSDAGGGWLKTNVASGETVQVCRITVYNIMLEFSHDGDNQRNIFQEASQTTTREICVPIVPDLNFQLQIDDSHMQKQRYVDGIITDDIKYSWSGFWPCSVNDPGSQPGNCAQYATIIATTSLYRLNSEVNNDFGEHLTSLSELGTTLVDAKYTNINFSGPSSSRSGTGAFTAQFAKPNYLGTPDEGNGGGFYTAQVSVAYAGSTFLHPSSLLHPNEQVSNETTSTYDCELSHSSRTSRYTVASGELVDDTLAIDGRCRFFDLPSTSAALRANDEAEVLLIGPLRYQPKPNAPSQHPDYICANISGTGGVSGSAGDWPNCIYSTTAVPLNKLNNGTPFNLSHFATNDAISPTVPGLYVYVYHFPGDVFTPEFFSDASDASEMFVVDSNHVQMFSKATVTAQIDEYFTDTVYISGQVRVGSYLTFAAYSPSSSSGTQAKCDTLLDDGLDYPISVGVNGGVYTSKPVRSSQIGAVFWIATLHNVDGSVYRDFYADETASGSVQTWSDLIGQCGEPGEMTNVTWTAALSSDASSETGSNAELGQPIWDVAHIYWGSGANESDQGDKVPDGISVEFKAYLDDGFPSASGEPAFTSRISISGASGELIGNGGLFNLDVSSDRFTPTLPGKYFWVASIVDQWGTVLAQGSYGDRSETSYIFEVNTLASRHIFQVGDVVSDEITLSGDWTGNLILQPVLFWQDETTADALADRAVMQSIAPIELIHGQKTYRTEPIAVNNFGRYYWSWNLINVDDNYSLVAQSEPRIASESFDVVDLNSTTDLSKYIGEEFEDKVNVFGNFPSGSCIYWELFYVRSLENDQFDKKINTSECQPINNVQRNYYSPEISTLQPGTYYWVASIKANTGDIIAQGQRREPTETITIKPLTNSAWTYSETASKVYVGERFWDTVRINGRIPHDSYMVWDIYKQSESTDAVDDTLIFSTPPKFVSEGISIEDWEVLISSEEVTIEEIGEYYWVEKLYSPLQNEPISVGLPRVQTESFEIIPLNHLLTTQSVATGFSRVGDKIFDTVYLQLSDDEFPECIFEDYDPEYPHLCTRLDNITELMSTGTISWKIYKKNLKSDDFRDDELILETDEIPLTNAILDIDAEQLTILSEFQVILNAGIYYWVEEIHSPLQANLVAIQEPRNFFETSVVEAPNTKYIKVGSRRNVPNLLAQTGFSIGKIVGTAAVVALAAKLIKKGGEKWRRKKKSRRNIWWGHSYWLH
jgi:hypothetical protein